MSLYVSMLLSATGRVRSYRHWPHDSDTIHSVGALGAAYMPRPQPELALHVEQPTASLPAVASASPIPTTANELNEHGGYSGCSGQARQHGLAIEPQHQRDDE